jgi:S-adenosyl-L-methionine hydrolase (adenosine-forming)
MGRPIVFLSDFGLDDGFPGICHGVIARIAPGVRVIDLTHGIPPQNILRGAVVLADAVGFMPEDSVYLAVVDPGVGGSRKAIAIETGSGAALVGPDNGLLSLACAVVGGATRVVAIESDRVLLPSVSRTFHGRDVFAPAAAHLAAGGELDDLGPALDPSKLAQLAIPEPEVGPGRIRANVLGIDRFGNVQLTASGRHLRDAGLDDAGEVVVRTVWQALPVRRASSFGEVASGEFAVLVDSTDRLAVTRNGGSAANAMRVGLGEPVVVESAAG